MSWARLFGAAAVVAASAAACGGDDPPTESPPLGSTSSSSSHASSSSGSSAASTGSGGASTSASSGGTGGSASSSSTGGGAPVTRPSCDGGLQCGDASCCEEGAAPAGSFARGRGDGSDAFPSGSADEQPEATVTLDAFSLDTFEVTVGRFRRFVDAYDGTPPAPGAGAHPAISDSGWDPVWDTELTASKADLVAALKCDAHTQTWTDDAGANENMPINCVTWYEAMAFCAWDNARLATEVEWEYVAAGGDDNRLYPWGADDPATTTELANDAASDVSPYVDVGSHASGAGRWGHADLGGSMLEWVLDGYNAAWYGGGGASCGECANLGDDAFRVARGGSWVDDAAALRAAARLERPPELRSINVGIRCAR